MSGASSFAVPTDRAMRPRLALPWVVQLRWLAVAGQGVAVCAAWALPSAGLPRVPLVGLALLTAASNAVLHALVRAPSVAPERLVGLALTLDTVVLTALLAWTGGPDNPFALLYAIHIAMAAVVGGRRWAWAIALIAVLGYAVQFRWHLGTPLWHQSVGVPGLQSAVPLHLIGMWISVLLVALVSTHFIQRVISALASHERALRHAQRRLAKTEQLAALTALTAGAAHELGSPLGTVAVVSRELERTAEANGASALARDASLIRDEVDRCREILDRMATDVQAAMDREGEPGAIADLLPLLAADLGEDFERLRLEPLSAPLPLPIAAPYLAQLLLPLIRNALDAAGAVEVRFRRAQGTLRIEVQDEGAGMSPAVLARVAEPRFTTKPAGQGTGLGLHFVKVIAEALGGQLGLESQSGAGTLATLVLRDASAGAELRVPRAAER